MFRSRCLQLLGLLSSFLFLSSCMSTGSTEESLGLGIVRGTLGAQSEGELHLASPGGIETVKGAVVRLEGGAYVLKGFDGAEYRIPLDQNTRIDRPAHIGDNIEAFLDRGGRAVLIRNIDHDIHHPLR